jgi:GT2 family glycosyltransferase
MKHVPPLTYVILTHNRREEVLRTLGRLRQIGPAGAETIVVDNASSDGTCGAVARTHPWARIIRRAVNEGSVARNAGVSAASSPVVMLLDDDSYPLGDTSMRAVSFLQANPTVGCVGGRVMLPDGSEDAAALPIVLPACAMVLRRKAFLDVGGFAPEFFRQAEEYDLIFRLLAAGWRVERFEDLLWRHEKTPTSRSTGLIRRMDLRNNLLLIHQYLPRPLRSGYRRDWLHRYVALAKQDGHLDDARHAIAEARLLLARRQRQTLRSDLIECVLQPRHQQESVRRWAASRDIRTVVIADFSKNIRATFDACLAAGLRVRAIADNHPAFAGLRYRGVPILPDAEAFASGGSGVGGVVLSNINPAQVERRAQSLAGTFDGPVLRLWHPKQLSLSAGAA